MNIMPVDWIDEDGFFLKGKHSGKSAEGVARDDPSYLRYLLENATSLSDEDTEIIRAHLKQSGRYSVSRYT